MVMRYIFYAFLIYLAYRFIFGFLIPVYRTTKEVKRQFRDAQNRMQEGFNDQAARNEENVHHRQSKPGNSTSRVGDYIDFEEVK